MAKVGHRSRQRVVVVVKIEVGELTHPVVQVGHDIGRQQ